MKLVEAIGLCFSYGGAQHAVDGVSFSAEPGEYLSIVGPNGSGKSTIFHLLTAYLRPQSGKALFCGADIHKIPFSERAKSIAIVHQGEDCSFPFTCFEMVLMGLSPHRARFERLERKSLEQAERVMDLTDTLRLAEKQITEISGGELQRVLLARAIAQEPRLLLLDEAMSDLDISAKISMSRLLRHFVSERGMSVIAINHDLNTAYSFSDHIVALKNGRVAADGTPREVLTESFLREVFGVRAEVFEDKGFFIYDNI